MTITSIRPLLSRRPRSTTALDRLAQFVAQNDRAYVDCHAEGDAWVAFVVAPESQGCAITDHIAKGTSEPETLHRLHLALSPLARRKAVALLSAVIDSAEECEAAVAAEHGAEMGG